MFSLQGKEACKPAGNWTSPVCLCCYVLPLYIYIYIYIYIYMGDRGSTVVNVLATNRKVAGSIPASVSGFFIDIKSFRDRTMALGSTQPLTEMSTRSISWG